MLAPPHVPRVLHIDIARQARNSPTLVWIDPYGTGIISTPQTIPTPYEWLTPHSLLDAFYQAGWNVIRTAGPGTLGSSGFHVAGSEKEIQAYEPLIEYVHKEGLDRYGVVYAGHSYGASIVYQLSTRFAMDGAIILAGIDDWSRVKIDRKQLSRWTNTNIKSQAEQEIFEQQLQEEEVVQSQQACAPLFAAYGLQDEIVPLAQSVGIWEHQKQHACTIDLFWYDGTHDIPQAVQQQALAWAMQLVEDGT